MSDSLEHQCAVCSRRVAHGYLMCFAHWKLVPEPEQRAVWRTWRRASGVGNVNNAWVRNVRADYSEARAAAIASVNAVLNPPPSITTGTST